MKLSILVAAIKAELEDLEKLDKKDPQVLWLKEALKRAENMPFETVVGPTRSTAK